MYLKEFDCDLPYVPNEEIISNIMKQKGCSFNDASAQDYQENWKAKRLKFRLETRCVTAMFERLFEKFMTNGIWKILVECVEDITDERVLNELGVLVVHVPFNFNQFITASDLEKQKLTHQLLMSGIVKVCSDQSWDLQPSGQSLCPVAALSTMDIVRNMDRIFRIDYIVLNSKFQMR